VSRPTPSRDIFRGQERPWSKACGRCKPRQLRCVGDRVRLPQAALGGHAHVARSAAHGRSLQSARNRHAPMPGRAAREWLAAREAELLPLPSITCVHVPAAISDRPRRNKAVIYEFCSKTSGETLIRHQGRSLSTSATRRRPLFRLAQWGSALTIIRTVHRIVPRPAFRSTAPNGSLAAGLLPPRAACSRRSEACSSTSSRRDIKPDSWQ